jgi:hypothetical protein
MRMDDKRGPEANGGGGDSDPEGESRDGQESAAEEALLREAATEHGEEVPLQPIDETPLEIPPELFREEVRSPTLSSITSPNHSATCMCWTM